MSKESRVIFSGFFLFVSAMLVVTYFRYGMMHDYLVEAEADCDPYMEKCFVYVCDINAGEECTGNPDEDTSYYKIIQRNANRIPSCDPSADDCQALVCLDGESQCEIILCDDTSGQDVDCTDPVAYAEQHPIVEDSEDIVDEDTTGDIENSDAEEAVVGEESDLFGDLEESPESEPMQAGIVDESSGMSEGFDGGTEQ